MTALIITSVTRCGQEAQSVNSGGHRHSQDFLWECTFFLAKNPMALFSHHPLLHGHIRHILPRTTFLSHLWGCTSPSSAPFLPHSNKNAYKKLFFVARGVHPPPVATPIPVADLALDVAGGWWTRFTQIPFRLQLLNTSYFELFYC